jgi:hypothetical protein
MHVCLAMVQFLAHIGKWTVEEEQLAIRDKRDSMPFKELYALARAAATWGSQRSGRKIMFYTDCQPNVDNLLHLTQQQ